jgi:hypothetical protein
VVGVVVVGVFEQVIRERVARFPIKRGKRKNGGRGECRWVMGDKQEKD